MKQKVLKRILLVCILLLFVFPKTIIAGEWIKDRITNCKIWNEMPEPNETVSWSGKCLKGYTSGVGTLQMYKDGKKRDCYQGEMKKGKLHGKGIYKYETGDTYNGHFLNGKESGKGTYTYANGNKYEGSFLDGKLHGKGTYTYADGDRYQGAIRNKKVIAT